MTNPTTGPGQESPYGPAYPVTPDAPPAQWTPPPPPPPVQPGSYYPPANAYGVQAHHLTSPTTLAVFAGLTAGLVTLDVIGDTALVGHAVSTGTGTGADALTALWGIAALAYFPLLLAAWVCGSWWLYLARGNAEALFPDRRHARNKGWAWGGWIAPVVFFWFPFQVVRDVRRAPYPLGRDTGGALVGWWWGVWLAVLIVGRIEGVAIDSASETSGSAGGVQTLGVIWSALMVLGLVLWLLVIRRITVDQNAAMRGERFGRQYPA